MSNQANVNIGNSGEYFVAGELERRGFTVAETISSEHRKWLETPGKNGQPHNETNIRNFFDKDDIYLDRWDLLDGAMLRNMR